MISPKFFVEELKKHDIEFYAGVPDSLLKNLCAYITDHIDPRHNIIAANEGGAMGIATGYHLATGRTPVVYMQNSGEGNIINPLASLTDADVYSIPVLLIIGWRGQPGVHDEPQHVKQGKVTLSLLEAMGVPYAVLSRDEQMAREQIAVAVDAMRSSSAAYALVVEKGTFEDYKLSVSEDSKLPLSREEAIGYVASRLDKSDVIVSTTGMISRELFEYREAVGEGHERDFLTVGSMGHASQIALGIAIEQPVRRVCCFDGDGAALMHMGGMAIVAQQRPRNYLHIVFNNGAHDSVGGQPTVGLDINLPQVTLAVGYREARSVSTLGELSAALDDYLHLDGPLFLQVCVHKGNRPNLGRPTTTPQQNKQALMQFLAEKV